LAAVAIALAAAAPLLASRALLQTSPADDIGFALLLVALIMLIIDRRP
jgi:hypothetical protein